ncbi:hypothetical protein [Kytococcus sedentarius]|uniref:AMP-binding enzyme n=1 Tax=Kytococcus sedentarius TaxID=1276 RepID=UPI0035BC5729
MVRFPGVAQVAVIGVPDDLLGEEILAVATTEEGATVDPDAFLAYGREQLGKHKYPRRVEIVEALPMGPSMKILKRELRSQFAETEEDA